MSDQDLLNIINQKFNNHITATAPMPTRDPAYLQTCRAHLRRMAAEREMSCSSGGIDARPMTLWKRNTSGAPWMVGVTAAWSNWTVASTFLDFQMERAVVLHVAGVVARNGTYFSMATFFSLAH